MKVRDLQMKRIRSKTLATMGRIIPIFFIKIKKAKGIPLPVICSRPYYIWKRTYHNLYADCLLDCDFVYRYLFKK